MSDYAYPYDPAGTNPACLVEGERHKLEDYPNKWGCIIPLFAPFYRKDLTLRHVEEDRPLHEGIDYYLGHYYEAASEENKMPIFGSVMIIDQTLSGTIEFVKYRTLGGRYNMLKRVIDVHLNQVDLRDPRNLDWEDVMRYEMAIPAVEAPKDIEEAIAKDLPTGALDRVRKALERLNAAQKKGYDDVIAAIIALGNKIHAHDVDNHESKRGRHRITSAQLGALHRDATAVDTLKAYGLVLADLVTLVNLLGENAEDTDNLFRLIGDTLEGRIRFESNNMVIQNEGGTAIINVVNGDMNILSNSNITLEADSNADSDGITASLRSGDNMLTVHSYVSEVAPMAIHATNLARPHAEAMAVSPTPTWAVASGRFIMHKQVYFPGGDVNAGVLSDNSFEMFINGVSVWSQAAYPNVARKTIQVDEGYQWVTIIGRNGTGPGFVAASFEAGGMLLAATDETWWGRDITGESEAEAVKVFPTRVDNAAVYNGFYLIHVGNIVDFLPPPDYTDTILHVDTTETVYLSGRGIQGSPLTGYVFYPAASSSSDGVFRLSHSIYSDNKTKAASGRALYALNQLMDDYVDNTFTINGHRLNNNITVTKADLGLSRVENTAPENKPASNAFKAEAAKKASADHTHSSADFENIPLANKDTYGLTKLTTAHSTREDVAATPVMLNKAYSDQLLAENNLSGKMPSLPFNIMQYGGFGYLPLPVLGSYGAAGIGSQTAVGCIESDGRLVMLRNGADLAGNGVYYWYAEYRTDGKFDKVVSTTTEYRPPFLDEDDHVIYVYRGGEGVFPLRTKNGKTYIVLTRNTMDMSKHVGVEIDTSVGMALGNAAHFFLYKNSVHCHHYYFGNSGCYSQHWTMSVDDIEAGRMAVPVRVKIKGTNWDGERIDGEDTFYFTKLGQSTSVDKKPIIHRLDNGHWNGSNNVRHATQNSMFAIKDNKLRVQVYGRSYYSRSNGSTGHPMAHSVTLNLDTMEIVSDNPENFPIRLYDNRWETPGGAPSEAWPSANPNNTSPVIVTKGRMFSFYWYGSTAIPRIHEFKSSTDLEPFDYAEAYKSRYATINSHYFEGSYGSIVGAGPKYMGFLPGNKLIHHQSDGKLVICTYDPDGSYVEDGSGWGPTIDRRDYGTTNFWRAIRVPMNWNSNKNEGFVLSSSVKTAYSKIVNEVPEKPVSWQDGVINDLLGRFRTLHPSDAATPLNSDRVMLHTFGDWEAGANTLACFIQYTVIRWQQPEQENRGTWTYTHKATITMAGGTVTGVTIGDLIHDVKWSGSTTGWGGHESFGMNTCGTTDDGHKIFTLNHSLYVGWVGHGGGHSFQFILDANDGSVKWRRSRTVHTHVMYQTMWHPDFGLADTSSSHAAQAVTATKIGRSSDDMTNKGSEVLHSTKVASGWIVYFTEESRFFVDGKGIMLPVQNFDLSAMPAFPNYRNTTFYIYVAVEYDSNGIGTGVYRFKQSKTADTLEEMYIGFAKTSDTQITELFVERATRLGMIYELEDHIYDDRAHNDITNLDKNSFSLGKVENMGMLHTLTLPTFKEVFDSWVRISHQKDSLTQPQNPGELNSWSYDEATDTLKCTINSASFIGFVSQEAVGDYVFDTLVGSPNGDNDALVIILAMTEDAQGNEHTLCAVRARSTETHMAINGKFDIWYNYHQPSRKLVLSGGGTASDGGWGGRYSRITAIRSGSEFKVTCTKFSTNKTIEGHSNATVEVTHQFSVDMMPELAIFKSGGQFGYGCMSQPDSTFINILRPDEQVGNYYASADTIRILSEKQAESVKFVTGQIGAGGNIPIPAGFTEAQCRVVLSFQGAGSAGAAYTYVSCLAGRSGGNIQCITKTRRVGQSATVDNEPGATCRYYLVARKKTEV